MSSYHSSFTYLNKNSKEYFGWIISHFSSSEDNGESETGLATESIYTASNDGTRRNLYGTKYSGAEPIKITLMKQDGGDFSIADNRAALKWLTGAQTDSWLDLYVGNEVLYRMRGHVQNVLQYKFDARIIGLIIVFEPASPWAFSSLQTVSKTISNSDTLQIDNKSDDFYTFVYPKIVYENKSGDSLVIENMTTGEETRITNLAINEIVTLDNNMFIISDKPSKIFGNTFNFVWPRLQPGVNNLTVTGNGDIKFEYYYFIKVGDCAIDIDALNNVVCDDFSDNDSSNGNASSFVSTSILGTGVLGQVILGNGG